MDEGRNHNAKQDAHGAAAAAGAKGRPRRRRAGNPGSGSHKHPSGWRNGLSMGILALAIAMVLAGPFGGSLENLDLLWGLFLLFGSITVAIVFDIIAVAVTAAHEAPFNAMAAKKVPGAREALGIVRNAARVNSLCADVIGDICGTLSGVVATPIILSLHAAYPGIPLSVTSMLVIGIIAFLTIGGKAAEKGFAVRAATSVILLAGRAVYYLNRITGWQLLRNQRQGRKAP